MSDRQRTDPWPTLPRAFVKADGLGAAARFEVPRRRAVPTRNAPVTLARREDLSWLLAAAGGPPPPLGPSAQALVDALARRGASFLSDLAAATGRLPGELEGALWELVSHGVVSGDGVAEPSTSTASSSLARTTARSRAW